MKMLMNGEWIDSISKEVIEVFNPATHTKIDEVPLGKKADIDAAVEYAKIGYKINRAIPLKDRVAYLIKASQSLLDNLEDLRETMVKENGKSWSWAAVEVKKSGEILATIAERAKEPLHIPVIILTSRTSRIFEEKGYYSGADNYVTKPFHPSVLKVQVESLLTSRQKLKDYFSKKITLVLADSDGLSRDKEFLNKAIQLVEDNLTNEKLNRDFLASKMAVSSSTLYRKIKTLTDLDITVFIRSIRLKRAAQMIKNKEDNISGIAYQVGFNDPKYFRNCFVKQFGVNPSQFGKQ